MSVADASRAVGDAGGRAIVLPRAMFGDIERDLLGFSIHDLPDQYVVV